jgi:amino acid adenylation domain-containing protein
MLDETQVQPTDAQAKSLGTDRAGDDFACVARTCESEHRWTSVPEMVAAQAVASPNAIALVAGSEKLTYAELDRSSKQLAHYFKDNGVGPDDLVGLSMKRSPSMVVAALATLKAGGAYVPLDSTVPSERLDFMLRDAEVRVLVTADGLARRLPGGSWRGLNLDEQADEIAAFSPLAMACPVTEENLAYMIYTSGSTGEPKGVEITHRGLANLVSWHCRTFQVSPQDRASHQAAVGFDAAVWEVWPYLAAGASVYLPSESCRTSADAMRDWLIEQGISITFLATPLVEQLLTLEWPSEIALRVLLTGADTLHRRPSQRLPFALVNNYGPTECSVVATSGTVAPNETGTPQQLSSRPSIGRPIDNTRVYIVDEEMREAPPGTAGELCIAGAGLARGYHKRADLTLQKFIPNPFSSLQGDRLYRTGDLARYLPSGEIEFLGRLDEQVKIRGFRVEPNEIVATLDEYSGVEGSAVVARENPDGEKSLVAYLVLDPAARVTATALREHLSKKLPAYMVPAVFVQMKSFPVTPNGKVDRAALPAAEGAILLGEDNFVAPQDLVQQRLARIISALLRLERIGANDNFFLLGGHSLLGTQLTARVRESFGVELPLLQLFDHPTLAEMSRAIENLILLKLESRNADGHHRSHVEKTPV